MKDLKKLTRMQGEYFIIAFLFTVVLCIFGLYAVQYGKTRMEVHENMMSYGFKELHVWLGVALFVILIVRSFFVSGKENREFLQTLPVKKKSWYLFDTISGIVFIFGIYFIMFLVYYIVMKLDGIKLVSLGKLFLRGMGASVVEYHVILGAGYLLKALYSFCSKSYQNTLEKKEEKTWKNLTE